MRRFIWLEYIVPLLWQNRQFRPSLFGSLLTLVGIVCAVALGIWQLDRAEQKQRLLDQFARGQAPTQALQTADVSLQRYRHVRVVGRYDSEHQVLLDNMPSAMGRAGFRVLTPLHMENGHWLLVDRGWIPLGATRTELPEVRVTSALLAQPVAISGRLDALPEPGMRLGENRLLGSAASWPRVLNFPRHAELEQLLDRKLLPGLLLLDAAEPQGYERAWGAHLGIGPPRHIAYAVQWFAMAFALLCVYLVVSFKAQARSDDRC